MMKIILACLISGGVSLLASLGAAATEPMLVRVNVFPGAQNVVIFAGLAKGIFAKHGLKVDLQFTPNSVAQRSGLAKSEFDIAHAAVDNAVAMVELQSTDAVIVLGGDNSLQGLYAQPEITTITALRGKIVIMDAPNTAYALLVKKILLNHGLSAGKDYTLMPTGGTFARLGLMKEKKEYAATTLNPPFSLQAEREGFVSLGLATKLLGPYQGTGAFVMRAWARANGSTLERYIKGYVESVRWVIAPSNRPEASALLAERLKISSDLAAASLERITSGGLAIDGRFDSEGFHNLLAIRAEVEGTWGGQPPAAEKYVDLSYYQRALAVLGP
jgi:ABC-type nitrate/sulfonate/bicarbonate transport system substrate-binding protein